MNKKRGYNEWLLALASFFLALITLMPSKRSVRKNFLGYKSFSSSVPFTTLALGIIAGFFGWQAWKESRKDEGE